METEQLESKIENKEATPNFGKLDQLANEAEQTGSGEGFMEPGKKAPKEKKRGRPSKEEAAKKAQDQKKAAQGPQPGTEQPQMSGTGSMPAPPSAESVMLGKYVTKALSNMGVAIANDPRASMTPDELEAGAEILARLTDKYMPQLMGQYGLEAAAIMTFGQYGLRVMALKKLKVREEMEKRKAMSEHFNQQFNQEEKKPETDSFKNPESPSLNVQMI